MSKITEIKKIEKPQMNEIERFIWWKKTLFIVMGLFITASIVPIYAFRRGMIELGVRISICFYGFLLLFFTMLKYKTKKPDEKYLKKKGIIMPKKKWWQWILTGLFMILRIWIIYIMYVTWRMV